MNNLNVITYTKCCIIHNNHNIIVFKINLIYFQNTYSDTLVESTIRYYRGIHNDAYKLHKTNY